MRVNHPWTYELTGFKPDHDCRTVTFDAEDAHGIVPGRGDGGEVCDFAGGGGNDAAVVATDAQGAGGRRVDEGADDDEVWAGAEGELRHHGEDEVWVVVMVVVGWLS